MSLRRGRLIFGPGEPEGFQYIRDAYWATRLWVDDLECRIMMTDAGLDWLARVKKIGHAHQALQ